MNLFLDIETLPAQRPDVLEEIRAAEQVALDASLAAIKPPGNYKKQETIDEWLATEAPKIAASLTAAFDANVEAAYRKTGLDGAFGQICVIGWALDDSEPRTVWSLEWAAQYCERELLEAFYCELTDVIPANMERATCVVGHNVSGFDLRYLTQRSIVNNVRPHRVIAAAAQAKPWESEKVFDTMVQWGGTGAKPGGSLDKLCRALSIPSPKGDITGATVWDAVKGGRIAEVAEYCARDVEAARAIWRRMTFAAAPVAVQQFEDVAA
jgi:hypothetical protein